LPALQRFIFAQQQIQIAIADALQCHRDAFADPPARIGRARAQGREVLQLTLGDQSSQADDAAERQELVRRVDGRARRVVGKVARVQRRVAFVGDDLSQFDVAARTRQTRFLQQERVPVLQRAQFFAVQICLGHTSSDGYRR
jgi:hypothetical protein